VVNIKDYLVSTLTGNAELMALINGEGNLHYGIPPVDATFPCLSYYEISNVPRLLGDDKELASEIVVQVDVWNEEGSTSDIALKVNEVLQNAGFRRTQAQDLDQEGQSPVIRRKAMRFKISKGVE